MELLVCHRDRLVADAIRTVLDSDGLRVIVAATVEDVLKVAPAADVCVIDVRLDGALETITRLVAMAHPPRVLALVNDTRHIRAAMRSGASGWVTTNDGLDRLLHMLTNESCGNRIPAATSCSATAKTDGHRHNLTAREAEVLAGLVRGENTKALAARLQVTPATARTHVQNVLAKLGVHSRLQAVALVVEQSLLPMQPESAARGMSDAMATGA